MRRKYYGLLGYALALVMLLSSVELPTLAAGNREEAAAETTEAQKAEPAVSGGDAEPAEEFVIPSLNYQDIPDEGEYESIREHLGDDMLTPVYGAIPSAYIPERSGGYIPALRDQNPYGSCWAHSVMAVAEIGLIKRGLADASLNLSELQLAYFMYNTPRDPLGLTEGDRNYLTGSDFMDAGGNVELAKRVLQGWICAAEDAGELAYGNAANVLANGLDDSYAFQNSYYLRNYYNVNIKEDPEAAKQSILDYGALTVSYFEEKVNLDKEAYYTTGHSGTNHAVVIVGWDDDYDKSKFSDDPAKRPVNNGAWLLRNSWSDREVTGYPRLTYFWISYEDTSLSGGVAMDFAPVTGEYDNNYHYDGGAAGGAWGGQPSGIKQANVFTSQQDETLLAVGFETKETNVLYEVNVYQNLQDAGNPESAESGMASSTVSGTTSYSGYFTVPLTTPVSLAEGETFSVVVTLSHADGSTVSIDRETNSLG